MPINSKHAEYDNRIASWEMCRDVAGGTDKVKDKGTKYLPKLSGQDANEYEAYKRRADFYGAFARTVQGIGGAVFRRPPTVEIPDLYADYTDDITLEGLPFDVFARTVFDEVLTVGRVGVYADMPTEGAADLPLRPYGVMVTAENIINWRSTWSFEFGRYILDMVVIAETVDVAGDDVYDFDKVDQFREFVIEGGVVVVRVWREKEGATDKENKWYIHEETRPMRLGQTLKRIPFRFINVTHITPQTQKPPLLDLAHANLSHYRTSADLEHGRHYTALPTPWVAGFPASTELRIGANIAWVADDPQAKAGILEFTGQGLGALENAAEQKEKRMAVLGARMLEAQPRGIEAADTVRLRQAGEAATVQGMISATEAGLSDLLGWMVWWGGGSSEEVSLEINRDVIDTNLQPQELTALTQALQSGGISYETYYYNLERGDMTRPDIDAATEREGIDNDAGAATMNRGQNTPQDNAEIAAAVNNTAGQ